LRIPTIGDFLALKTGVYNPSVLTTT